MGRLLFADARRSAFFFFAAATLAAAFSACSKDLFHSTDWVSLCEKDPQSSECLGTTSSTGGASTSSSGTGGAQPSSCDSYCQTVMAGCTEMGTAVYSSPEVCLGVCMLLPPGIEGDMSGNSLQCRRYHAGLVPVPPIDGGAGGAGGGGSSGAGGAGGTIGTGGSSSGSVIQCPAAGPSGGDICGSACDTYCSIMAAACPGTIDPTTCPSICAMYTSMEPFSIAASGDTVQCRLRYACDALVDPMQCDNAGAMSAVCVAPMPDAGTD